MGYMNVSIIKLNFNKLKTIHKKSLRLLGDFKTNVTPSIFLGGNPLRCNCDLEWLAEINSNN